MKINSHWIFGLACTLLAPLPALAQNQVFLQPIISQDSTRARVDRCILNSSRFNDGCSEEATQEVANQFCRRMGYQRAINSSNTDRLWQEREVVWKYDERAGLWVINEGGWILDSIECSGLLR